MCEQKGFFSPFMPISNDKELIQSKSLIQDDNLGHYALALSRRLFPLPSHFGLLLHFGFLLHRSTSIA